MVFTKTYFEGEEILKVFNLSGGCIIVTGKP